MHIRMHHINSIHTCSMLASNTHASHQQPSLLRICFCFQQLQTNPPSTPPFFLSSHSHTNHPLPSLLAVCSFFHGFAFYSLQKQNNRARGCVAFQAWKGTEALLSCLSDKHKKRAQLGTASQQMAFPGRELASVPGRALANVPRQGTGKASQAGTAKTCPGRALANVPRQGTGKRSQAGNWQASQAGTASMPRQGMHTGKRSQAGNWQASQAGTANVPRQGTGKCSQAGDSGCSHAGNCKALQKFSNDMPPTPRCHSTANQPRVVWWACMLAHGTMSYS